MSDTPNDAWMSSDGPFTRSRPRKVTAVKRAVARRMAYSAAVPILWGLNVGMAAVLQWIILPPRPCCSRDVDCDRGDDFCPA